MPTFMQKIRLVLRGWNRRREERNREFVAKKMWGPASAGQAAPKAQSSQAVDIDGLTVAYLDGSGRTDYYLDTETGDVIEAANAQLDSLRYKRIPVASHEEDRQAFLATVSDSGDRAKLSAADSFRSVLADDRALERAWYTFRNNRAIAIIEGWLREIGLK